MKGEHPNSGRPAFYLIKIRYGRIFFISLNYPDRVFSKSLKTVRGCSIITCSGKNPAYRIEVTEGADIVFCNLGSALWADI